MQKNLDILKKEENNMNNVEEQVIEVPKDEIIKVLKILEGLKRTLLKIIKT